MGLVLALVGMLAKSDADPVRVRPPNGAAADFRPMWCAPSFSLDQAGPLCTRQDVSGVSGAFVLDGVLSREEASRMVDMAERMGFEDSGESGASAGRSSGAVTWCFHANLAEQMIKRMAKELPWAVAVHSSGSPAPTDDQLPRLQSTGALPWVRALDGAPEGMYTLDGMNVRTRLYRYEGQAQDRFLPHFDEVWPGSRLVFGADGTGLDGEEPTLEQDRWRYSDGPTAEATSAWAWSYPSDRVSHLSTICAPSVLEACLSAQTQIHSRHISPACCPDLQPCSCT